MAVVAYLAPEIFVAYSPESILRCYNPGKVAETALPSNLCVLGT